MLALVLAGPLVQLDNQIDARIAAGVGDAAAAVRIALARVHGGAAPQLDVIAADEDWQTGTLAIPAGAPGAPADEPRVFVYVAQRDGQGWAAAIEGTAEFPALARQAAEAVADDDPQAAALLSETVTAVSGDGAADLSLPWATSVTRRLTGGPHSYDGSGRPWSSLDFAGPEPGMSVKVRAARDGIVVRPCRNLVQVRHGDGWMTSYYHLHEIAVSAGERVERGQFLGRTSNRSGCGGASYGAHVHFSLFRNGSPVNIAGHAIGGWVVEEGDEAYEGCLRKDGTRRCVGDSIYNNGDSGVDSYDDSPFGPLPAGL